MEKQIAIIDGNKVEFDGCYPAESWVASPGQGIYLGRGIVYSFEGELSDCKEEYVFTKRQESL